MPFVEINCLFLEEIIMEVKVRPDIGQLQGQDPERREESENLMTFEEFLNSFEFEMERMDEIDKGLPFTDD